MPKDTPNAATALGPTGKERRTLRGEKNKLEHKKCFKENTKKWSTALGNICIRKPSKATTKKTSNFPHYAVLILF